jgi:serine/threonine protein kinase
LSAQHQRGGRLAAFASVRRKSTTVCLPVSGIEADDVHGRDQGAVRRHRHRHAGTLPYMAPEQTGRMNRSIDSRSDLYALGVTL